MKFKNFLFATSFFISAATGFSIAGGYDESGEGSENVDGKSTEMVQRQRSESARSEASIDCSAKIEMGAEPTIKSEKDIASKKASDNDDDMEIKTASPSSLGSNFSSPVSQGDSPYEINAGGSNDVSGRVTCKSIADRIRETEYQKAETAVRIASEKYTAALEENRNSACDPAELAQLDKELVRVGKQLAVATKALTQQGEIEQPIGKASSLENQIHSRGEITIYGESENGNLGDKETVPLDYSLIFGSRLCDEIAQHEQKDFVKLLQQKKMPFNGMKKDLMRDNFEIADENEISTYYLVGIASPDDTADKKFDRIMAFIGNHDYLRIAIANLMHQRGLAIAHMISFGVLAGYNNILAREVLAPKLGGPIHTQLRDGQCDHSYRLKKTSRDEKLIFKLTIKTKETNQLDNMDHDLDEFLTFEFSENQRFDATQPVSEENLPVIICCCNGGITRSFKDKRTPEQKSFQKAEFDYIAACKKKGLSAQELDSIRRFRDLKKAEYDVFLAQKECDEIQQKPVKHSQRSGFSLFSLSNVQSRSDAAEEMRQKMMTAAAAGLENAKSVLKEAQKNFKRNSLK